MLQISVIIPFWISLKNLFIMLNFILFLYIELATIKFLTSFLASYIASYLQMYFQNTAHSD